MAHREFLLREVVAGKGIMQLLMKHRNTGRAWTRNEVMLLRMHFLRLALIVPALFIFLLPFGWVLLPVLAEVLDRRHKKR